MKNQRCRFCTHNNQPLYASVDQILRKGDLIKTLNQELKLFFFSSYQQNNKKGKAYYLCKSRRLQILDNQQEYLRQFYYYPNSQNQLKQLIQYYKFSIDHPLLYFIELKAIILKYISSRSQFEYQWAINQIEIETNKECGVNSKKDKKKSVPVIKQELSCFLKELNDTQRSNTILQLLKNVEADRTLEKDLQKQFTQSLIEQDLTKAIQFSTFLQQQELLKQKEITNTNSNFQVGNIKKKLNLQLGTPRKASNIIINNFSTGCSTHTNQNVNTQKHNINGGISTHSNHRIIVSNNHFFNLPQQENNNVNHNFITKTSIVNSFNGNNFKAQTIYKMQPLRLREVPKLKIKLNHQDPKSERKYDRVRENKIDCLTQRVKTQLDESNIVKGSVNTKSLVFKRRQKH